MRKNDDGGEFVGLIIGLIVIGIVIYLAVLLATVIIGAAVAGGTVFGGLSALKNYCVSFKENVIDSNMDGNLAL